MYSSFTPFVSVSSATSTAAIDLSGQLRASERGRAESTVQVTLAGTATVDIEARLDSTLGWAKIETGITANKIVRIGQAQAVRLTVTAWTSGAVGGGVLI